MNSDNLAATCYSHMIRQKRPQRCRLMHLGTKHNSEWNTHHLLPIQTIRPLLHGLFSLELKYDEYQLYLAAEPHDSSHHCHFHQPALKAFSQGSAGLSISKCAHLQRRQIRLPFHSLVRWVPLFNKPARSASHSLHSSRTRPRPSGLDPSRRHPHERLPFRLVRKARARWTQ